MTIRPSLKHTVFMFVQSLSMAPRFGNLQRKVIIHKQNYSTLQVNLGRNDFTYRDNYK